MLKAEEDVRKKMCLYHLEHALNCAEKDCNMVYDSEKEIIDVNWKSGKKDRVRVAGDSVMAMLYDIFRQIPFYQR